MKKDYYLGLDVGTDSVGFCVTDKDYNIIAKRAVRWDSKGQRYYTKKHLWGSRLFDEAQTAAERRGHRAARRRYQRRRWRLLMLRDFFRPEMAKVDSTFFDRLDHSFFHSEDRPEAIRSLSIPYPSLTETKKFYQRYKTIYHLRLALLRHPEKKFDLREIFLAFSHMVKYRGNFLWDGDISLGSSNAEKMKLLFSELDACLQECLDQDDCPQFHFSDSQSQELYGLFLSETRKSLLKEKESRIFADIEKKDIRLALLGLINGSGVKLTDLFPEYKENEEAQDLKIEFEVDDFDAAFGPISDTIDDSAKSGLILAAKRLYDFRVLSFLLQGKESVSEAMVALYDKHKKDLGNLKGLIRKYAPDKYRPFFKLSADSKGLMANYVNYVAYNRQGAGKQEKSLRHSTDRDALYKAIKEILPQKEENYEESDWRTVQEIYVDMDKGTFLPRLNSKDNSVLPYQLTLEEMKRIIDNQKAYYPFLAEEDKDFRNPERNCYKLLSLVSFRIPYFVGPLSGDKREDGQGLANHWMVRKIDGVKITPWNFYDVVDTAKSEMAFIDRMKNACTYLLKETTLPKDSLLYTEYVLLNEMNNWMVNGRKLTTEDKKVLFDVYLSKKNPKKKDLEKAIARQYNAATQDEVHLQTRTAASLEDADLHATLGPWIDMERIFGKSFHANPDAKALAEKAIEILTLFEDRKERKRQLEGLPLSKEQIRHLLSLRYSGWGKLSRTLLDGLKSPVVNPETAEEQDLTVIEIMRLYPLNLMEILAVDEPFTFKKQIEEINAKEQPTEEEIIEGEYVSPGMKRALHQTVKIVKELCKILKIDGFASYFVETTREKSKNHKRTKSRYDRVKELYKSLRVTDKELLDHLNDESKDALQKDKLFLYYMQLGKSVYTGQPIDLDNFQNYDIDHIIPQAKLKDDSFDNRVLVEKTVNIKKSDTYPIPQGIITPEGRKHIDYLYKCQVGKERVLMSSEKYRRLTRPASAFLTDEEQVGFVNRQLVMTSQSVKAVCSVLRFLDPTAKVVYSKAGNVSEFRKAFHLVKSRDANDFHHAHDAYLNIVVGNTYDKVFSSSFDVEALRRNKAYFESLKISPADFFRRDLYITNRPVRIWKAKRYEKGNPEKELPDSEGTIDLIRRNLLLNDPMVTKMVREQAGGILRKSQIHPSNTSSSLPLKESEILSQDGFQDKYGGYSDLIYPDFSLVQSEDKGKKIYSLESIPAVYRSKIKDKKDILKYYANNLKLHDPKIIILKVKINSIIEFFFSDINKKVRVIIKKKESKTSLGGAITSPLWLPVQWIKYVKLLSVFLGTNLPAGQLRPDLTKMPETDEDIQVGMAKITKAENQDFFDYLCDDVFKRPCFALIPGVSSALKNIVDARNLFTPLSTKDQAQLLHNIVSYLQLRADRVDLRLLGLGKASGKISFSKNLMPGTRLIAKSVTGFYEKILFTVPED